MRQIKPTVFACRLRSMAAGAEGLKIGQIEPQVWPIGIRMM